MKVTVEVKDQSIPAQPNIRIHSSFYDDLVEIEVEGKEYRVDANEMISAIKRCVLNGDYMI